MAGAPPKGASGLKAAITVAALAATLVGWAAFAVGDRPPDATRGAASGAGASPGPPAAEAATDGAPRSEPPRSGAAPSSEAALRGLRAVDVQLPPRPRPDVRTRASRRR